MKITCKECGEIFKSVIIDKTSALIDVSKQLGNHVGNKHQEVVSSIARQVGEILGLIHNRLMYQKFVKELETIDEKDPRQLCILDAYNNQEDTLISLLELPIYDNEEEEESEEKEG